VTVSPRRPLDSSWSRALTRRCWRAVHRGMLTSPGLNRSSRKNRSLPLQLAPRPRHASRLIRTGSGPVRIGPDRAWIGDLAWSGPGRVRIVSGPGLRAAGASCNLLPSLPLCAAAATLRACCLAPTEPIVFAMPFLHRYKQILVSLLHTDE